MSRLIKFILVLGVILMLLSLIPIISPNVELSEITDDLADFEANSTMWSRDELQVWSKMQNRRIDRLEDLLKEREKHEEAQLGMTALDSARDCNVLFLYAIDHDVSPEAILEIGQGIIHGELAAYWFAASIRERENGNVDAALTDIALAKQHAELAGEIVDEYHALLGLDLSDREALFPKFDLAISLTIAFMIGFAFIYLKRYEM